MKLTRVAALAIALLTVLAGASCSLHPPASALFGELKKRTSEDPSNRKHLRYDVRSSSILVDAQSEIEKLERDGFRLDSPSGAVACGKYKLSTGIDGVRLRREGRFLDANRYFIDMTVNDQCSVLLVRGDRLPPVSF